MAVKVKVKKTKVRRIKPRRSDIVVGSTKLARTETLPAPDPLLRTAGEMFTVRPTSDRPIPVGKIQLVVNGQDKGVHDVSGRKLAEFAVGLAERAGISNFSIYADGVKLTKAASNARLDDPEHPVLKLEIVAKDARA